MKNSLLFKQVLTLGISLLLCCNAICQSNVSSGKTYVTPGWFLKKGIFIMSFDYDNNKSLEIVYSTGSIVIVEEFNFKQIGDTL